MIFLFTLEYSTLYAVILIWETLKKFIASLPVLSFFNHLVSLPYLRTIKESIKKHCNLNSLKWNQIGIQIK